MARIAVVAALCMLVAGCGDDPEPEQAPEPEQTTGYELPPTRNSVEVEGLMGTIPERKILATLEPKLRKFQRCFFNGAVEVEQIGGHIDFYFRVGLDGRVEWVYPRGSSIGHRGTERCLLDEAKKARFPEPRGGGAAELGWGFEIESVGGGRPPVSWDASRVAPALERGRAALAECGGGSFEVTAYVAPGGTVLGAGASVDGIEAAEHIDCIVDAVKTWQLPDPGSYPAKVTFRVQ